MTVRGALVYLVLWSPLILIYALLIGGPNQQPIDEAVNGALMTVGMAALLGLPSLARPDESVAELRRREVIFAEAQERYYEHPPQIERGWRHHLIDTTGRSHVDMVNNVAGLGHGHPAIAAAADRQLRTLATNSRFLFRDLAEYSERLIALMPQGSGLDTVLLVNSGSEAVDLALRLAQAATGRRTVVALREAYHGWTMASDAVTTSAYDNPHALESRPDWVHVADVPNPFRGTYRGDGAAAGYLVDLDDDLDALGPGARGWTGYARQGHGPRIYVREGAGIGVIEMVVGGGRGVVDDVAGIHGHFPHQAMGTEGLQGVVDRGLRDATATGPQLLQDLVGGQVGGPSQEERADLEPLGRRVHAVLAEHRLDLGRFHLDNPGSGVPDVGLSYGQNHCVSHSSGGSAQV